MDRIKIVFTLVLVMVMGISHATTVHAVQSPVGYWKTIDEKTGKPKSIIKIWETSDRVLMGKIVKVFSPDSASSRVGIVILSDLKEVKSVWEKGKWFNPENGKTYHCNLQLTDNGKRLNMQHYFFLPLPLLEKSQIWTRVDLLSDSDRFQS